MASPIQGTQLGGYTLQRLMARGGMGEVYEATENKLQRRVALKVIAPPNPDEHDQDELISRFLQEARTLAQINHPNVVTIYSIDSVGGIPFIAMEYIEGVSFRELLEEFTFSSDGALPLFLQMLEGLKCLHENRIIHRDLKPHNILLRPDGAVKILDFGIAKNQGGQHTQLTKVGVVVGTLPYMPPEVKTGVAASQRSDIWSLGAIFFECLTGERLVQAQADASSAKDVPFTQEQSKKIPREMRAILSKMCASRPGERYASCNEVIDELQRYQHQRPAVPSQIWQNLAKKVEEVAAIKRREALDNVPSPRLLELAELSGNKRPMKGDTQIRDSSPQRLRNATPPERKSISPLWIGGALMLLALVYVLVGDRFNSPDPSPSVAITAPTPPTSPTSPAEAPKPLSLKEPANDQLLWLEPSRIPTLTWSRLIGAGEYDVQISLDPAFQKVVIQEPASGTSFRPGRILGEGRYYWRLWPHGLHRPIVGPQHFTVSNLTPVDLVQPDAEHVFDLQTAKTAGINFTWTCKAGSNRYRLQISGDENFALPSVDNVLSTCAAKGIHLGPGDHYWRVRMEDVPAAQSLWSEPRVVAVDAPTPAVASAVKPRAPVQLSEPRLKQSKQGLTLSYRKKPRDLASLAKSIEQVPVLQWSAVKGAKAYLVQWSASKDFIHLLSEEKVNGTSVEWPGVVPGRIYWRVAALGSGNRERSNFSERGLLDVFLPAPVINSAYKFEVPAEGEPQPVTLDWSVIPLAEKYIVQIGKQRDLASAQERVTTAPNVPLDGVPGVYYMRVAAADTSGQPISAFSNLAMVEVETAHSLDEPKPLSPPVGARAVSRSGRISILFSWSKVASADSYILEVAGDPEFKQILERRSTKDRGSLLKQAELKGRVYWRVRASGAPGNSPWSKSAFFDVK